MFRNDRKAVCSLGWNDAQVRVQKRLRRGRRAEAARVELPAGGRRPAEVLALKLCIRPLWPRDLSWPRRSFSACVLRTASASISRSSALVFGGSRLGGCHCVMNSKWGRPRGIKRSPGLPRANNPSPLLRSQRTQAGHGAMSEECQIQTHALQQLRFQLAATSCSIPEIPSG
jgi:hypothetical protein